MLRFIPTYDVDEAFSYKHKSFFRNTGAIGKAIIKRQWSKITERKRVLSGKLRDPFDSYEWMEKLHDRYNLHPRYFFLVSEKTGKYDRNILPSKLALQQLTKGLAEKNKNRYSSILAKRG